MKKLLMFLVVLFVGLNFIACAEKKDNKTRLSKGAGRSSSVQGTAEQSGWNLLNQYSELTELSPQGMSPDQAARNFINNDEAFQGPSGVNGIQMRLVFSGNSLNGSQTRVGFKFYDNYYDPLAYFVGPETGAQIRGQRNSNKINVSISESNGGSIEIEAYDMGSYLQGTVRYDGGAILGQFQVTKSKAIFNY